MRWPPTSTTTPALSGIECAIRTSSRRNGPSSIGPSSGTHLDELRAVGQLVLGELRLDEAEREARADDPRHVHLAQEVRQAAHVILVRVREHDGVDGAPAVDEIRDVGQHEVDAEVLVAREREPGVDDEAAAVALDHRHVLSHLAEAAERDDADGISHGAQCMVLAIRAAAWS